MEFWGVEVKKGESLKVTPGDGMLLHLSQACLGEQKQEKRNESVCLFVNVGGKTLVLGTLFTNKLPQQQIGLVFDTDFELSHNWKNGSVYFHGYRATNPFEEDELPDGDSEETEPKENIPLNRATNGIPELKSKQEKAGEVKKPKAAGESGSGKQKVMIVESKEDMSPEEEESDDEDSTSEDGDEDSMSESKKDVSSEEEESDDEDSTSEDGDEDSTSEDEDNSDSSDEETPKKVQLSKKRTSESALKTPISDKKANVTPERTEGRKVSGHVDTPYPKQVGKPPVIKFNQQTSKPGGSHSCKSCNRTFGSDKALESHSKAKHG